MIFAGCTFPVGSSPSPSSNGTTSTASESAATSDSTAALLKNSVIYVPGTQYSVTLGEPEQQIPYGSVDKPAGFLVLGARALKIGNNIVTTFSVNKGDQDKDVYVALFRNKSDNGWEMTQSRQIGHNIDITNFSLSRNGVTVNYLKRGPEQAATESPNVPASTTFSIQDGQLKMESSQ